MGGYERGVGLVEHTERVSRARPKGELSRVTGGGAGGKPIYRTSHRGDDPGHVLTVRASMHAPTQAIDDTECAMTMALFGGS